MATDSPAPSNEHAERTVFPLEGETEAEILIASHGGLGHITLNRPRALNALSPAMIDRLTEVLEEWSTDDQVAAVLIDGAGERGLSAGGDIRAVYEAARAGDPGTTRFWRHEYAMNVRIAEYPKPYIAIMDGLVMGGGVGVSAHGSVRIVTERSTVGMPETGIGFAPDVGGTYLLSRAPGELGTHLGLTGLSMGPGDAIACGFADHFLPADRLPEALAIIREAPAEAAAAIAEFAAGLSLTPPPAPLNEARGWIDDAYAGDSVEEIVERLAGSPEPEARAAADLLGTKAPTSLKVTLASLRAARERSLREVIEQEFRVSVALTARSDLVEGVRAQIIDKDRNPRWSPASLADVDDELVAAILRGDVPGLPEESRTGVFS